ncbi:MAG: ABC transporter ATP-binding protein, partial [Chitinophagaceae bacterium]|nr:ABC transporter ATP-binding protein [Rubrivivax sp.]
YEGGVQDWLLQSRRSRAAAAAAAPAAGTKQVAAKDAATAPAPSKTEQTSRKKLSYKEQRELDTLPQRIEALEKEQAEVQGVLADGSVYATDGARATKLTARASEIDEELMAALERWTALSA